jgi:hypothetical protein
MKTYKVIDLQHTGFMSDTHEEPETLKELRERFWGLYQSENIEEKVKFKDFTREYIEDLWEVRIEETQFVAGYDDLPY